LLSFLVIRFPVALMPAKRRILQLWSCFWCLQPWRNDMGKLLDKKI